MLPRSYNLFMYLLNLLRKYVPNASAPGLPHRREVAGVEDALWKTARSHYRDFRAQQMTVMKMMENDEMDAIRPR